MDFLRMLLAVCTLLVAPAAHAMLIFSFSFDDSAGGGTAGPITGEVHLLEITGPQKPTKVLLTGIGSHSQFGHALPPPIDVMTNGWVFNISNAFFVVEDTDITAWNFSSFHEHSSVLTEILDLGIQGGGLHFLAVRVLGQAPQITRSSTDPDFLLLHQASAPAPTVLALLVIGSVGLCFARRRKPGVASR